MNWQKNTITFFTIEFDFIFLKIVFVCLIFGIQFDAYISIIIIWFDTY